MLVPLRALKARAKEGIGTWRSLVAHWHGGPEVAGSNPAVPTILTHP